MSSVIDTDPERQKIILRYRTYQYPGMITIGTTHEDGVGSWSAQHDIISGMARWGLATDRKRDFLKTFIWYR